jgi:uncharacterized protein YigA (DUF484 family)
MSQGQLTSAQIAAYLKDHPNFLKEQPELLMAMALPHESGGAISLLERQAELLKERNLEMRQRLSRLMDVAKENDRLFERTQRLVLALLECETATSTCHVLLDKLTRDYGVEYCHIWLFGSAEESLQLPMRDLAEAKRTIGPIMRSNRPICGMLQADEVEFLLPGDEQPKSIAVAPLNDGQTFGVLVLGSDDPSKYKSSVGTLFLSYVADIVNRILPRQLAEVL